jgi:hypothetical protein
MEIVNAALANTIFEKVDTEIVFDGEQFHIEDVIDKSFIRGYVIDHTQYNVDELPDGKSPSEDPEMNNFQYWLAMQLWMHVNKMCEYFYTKEKLNILPK